MDREVESPCCTPKTNVTLCVDHTQNKRPIETTKIESFSKLIIKALSNNFNCITINKLINKI